ncbi:hypothetical protein HanIR_Chr14g0679281 [Helianthus annuus]|nr:hypothetical protein HanIR_Chr14g0679281 [Helianthus annuus]
MAGNNITLPLVQMSGRPSLLNRPVYYFMHTLKLRFCPGIVFLYHCFKWAASNTHWTNQFIILYTL